MKWSSSLSEAADLGRAIDEVVVPIERELHADPDIVFVFASGHHRIAFDRLPGLLGDRLGHATLVGCSASGVIGGSRELEHRAGLAVTAATLPGVEIDAWRLEADDLAPGSEHHRRCAALAQRCGDDPPQILIFADPFTFPTERLLRSFGQAFEHSVIAGGLASGGDAPGECALFLDQGMWYSGALVVALSGNIEMDTAVAQGCRPIGEPMFVSSCDGNRLDGLDGRSPFEVLNDLFAAASDDDRRLMSHSLFLGVAMRPGENEYARGDYLVRNVMGGDPRSGALWIGAELHERQVVQFHLRDAQTSAEDLGEVLGDLRERLDQQLAPSGGLLFSCTGRGEGLYGVSGHDSGQFVGRFGEVPLGGFFCNGEIGQVAGLPFVHGYTSAFAVFRPRR